jgi:hypothetical protein
MSTQVLKLIREGLKYSGGYSVKEVRGMNATCFRMRDILGKIHSANYAIPYVFKTQPLVCHCGATVTCDEYGAGGRILEPSVDRQVAPGAWHGSLAFPPCASRLVHHQPTGARRVQMDKASRVLAQGVPSGMPDSYYPPP